MMRSVIISLFTLFLAFSIKLNSFAQSNFPLFDRIELQIDTMSYNSDEHAFIKDSVPQLYFHFNEKRAVSLFRLYPTDDSIVKNIELMPSGDYDVVDSLVFIEDEYLNLKLRFKDLINTNYLKLRFKELRFSDNDTTQKYHEVHLLPLTQTKILIREPSEELYVGEEKIFDLDVDFPSNLRIKTEWKKEGKIEYRLSELNGKVRLHLLPRDDGRAIPNFVFDTRVPYMLDNKLYYKTIPFSQDFTVKTIRLQFLNVEADNITMDDKTRIKGIETQIDMSSRLQMNKTYRIENQEQPGGTLIGEIFTKSTLASGKALCIIRPYNFHRNNEGYLYIKDGDRTLFITNFNVTPKTTINDIKILHEGAKWKSTNKVHPGELIHIRLEGIGFNKASFHFEDLTPIDTSSLTKNDQVTEYKLKIPIDISKKRLDIYNHDEPTEKFLKIEEFQRPREFDFVNIDYGQRKVRLASIRKPLINFETIKDVNVSFSEYKIDSEDKLFGKQYLDMEVIVRDKSNKLIEMKEINDIEVCPSDNSPRYPYYDKSGCLQDDINLNQYLRNKTYELPEWSRITLKTKHDEDKYDESIKKKEIEIIQGSRYKFDVEVSFPAGLISIFKDEYQEELIRRNESGEITDTVMVTKTKMNYGKFSGISMAMMAQFSFYHPDKIATYRPYKVGAGFLALNAFNFQENADKDLAIVVLGSVYPTTKDTKLSFPLYVGGGYLVQESKMIFLIGPGIRVTL